MRISDWSSDVCSSDLGKFLEVLARAMEIALDAMGGVALEAEQELKISSRCATLAETEVIALLAEGHGKLDVLAADHASIANRPHIGRATRGERVGQYG